MIAFGVRFMTLVGSWMRVSVLARGVGVERKMGMRRRGCQGRRGGWRRLCRA